MTQDTTTFQLPYGTATLPLRIPADRCLRAGVGGEDPGVDPLEAFESALQNPMGSAPLEDLARGRKICLILDDATRSEPHDAYVRACLPRLRGADAVTAIIATGSHEVRSEGNLAIIRQFRCIAEEVEVDAKVFIHDCHEEPLLADLGRTRRGTPVRASIRALEADLFVASSDMKNHYFAGYSNPLKNFLPGVCSYDSIEANHALALDPRSSFGRHPWHPDPDRRDNPVALDMQEARQMITGPRDIFVLASVCGHGGVLWAGAGDIHLVTRAGIEKVDEVAGATVPGASRVIVCPGGDPQDESLYNAQRGVELAKNCMRDGAEVLLLAPCPKGVAPTPEARTNFFDLLTSPLEEVLDSLEDRYVLYSHKAYKFAALLKRLGALYLHTELDERTVRAGHMKKTEDPQAVVDRWVEESDEPILVVEDANKVALYADR
jgi:nickel-dependent lactate racemase